MLSFIDISGDFNARPEKDPYIVAAAITVRQRSIGHLTREIHNLKRDILNNETLEIKSTSFLNRDTLNHPRKSKYNFIESIFNRCIDYYDCYYAAVVIKNEAVRKVFPRDRLSKHYIYLLQRIQETAVRQHCDTVIAIIDNSNRRIDKWAAYGFNNYLYRTDGGHSLDRILEVPVFADSEMTIGIQLADLVAGLLRQYYSNGLHCLPKQSHEDLYLSKLREYYSIVSRRAPDFQGLPGLFVAREDFLSLYYT